MRTFAFAMALIFTGCWNEVSAYDVAQAKRDGQNLANSNLGKVQSTTQRSVTDIIPGSDNTTAGQGINFQGTEVPEKAYIDGNMEMAARNKAVDESFTAGDMAKKGFLRGKEFEIKANDTFLDKAQYVQKHPEEYVKGLSGKYTDCESRGGADVKYLSLKTCDEYQEITNNSCKIGQVIEVDAKHRYECVKKRITLEKKCTRQLKVNIIEDKNILSGLTFVARPLPVPRPYLPGAELSYNYPLIKLKPSKAHPYFVYDPREKSTTFYTTVNELSFVIAGKNKVTTFKIEQSSASVYVLKFNNKLLTTDEDSSKAANCLDKADKLCPGARHKYVESVAPGFSSLPQSYLDINGYDLTPYLVDGVNKLTFSSTFKLGQERPEVTIKVQSVDIQENWAEFCEGGVS